jgi:hypothetical protein
MSFTRQQPRWWPHPIAGVAFNLVQLPGKTRLSGARDAAGAGLGCNRHTITRIKTSGGENGMVSQPVHEFTPRGRVRGGFAFIGRGPSRFFSMVYPIACFVTTCQLHVGLHSSDHGSSLCSSIWFLLCPASYRLSPGAYPYARELRRCCRKALVECRRPH